MLIEELLDKIKVSVDNISTIHTYTCGMVYNNWNTKEIAYSAVNVYPNTVEVTNETITHNLTIYYADKLNETQSNEYNIYDYGIISLEYIKQQLENNNNVVVEMGEYHTFNQKFADELAGVYVDVEITTKNNIGSCNTIYNADFNTETEDETEG